MLIRVRGISEKWKALYLYTLYQAKEHEQGTYKGYVQEAKHDATLKGTHQKY